MQTSPSIAALATALAAAQPKFRAVTKDRNASIQSAKGSFRYSYADLATVVGAIKEALAANGLAVLQPTRAEEGAVIVTTLLAHSSGEWVSEEMRWPVVANDNRSIGSGITYARRHSLLAIVGGAATDEDDDAESARGGDHATAQPMKPQPPPQKVKPTLAQRKEAIVSELKTLGYEMAGIKVWVREVLGKEKAETDSDADRLDSALVILRAGVNAENQQPNDDDIKF